MAREYNEARAEARRKQIQLTVEQATTIRRELSKFVDVVARRARGTARIIQEEILRLEVAIAESIAAGRSLTFKSILEIWQQAGKEYAQRQAGALPSQVQIAPITMLGAFESLSPGGSWKSILPQYIRTGGREVEEIIKQAIAERMSPDDLARRLRKYVVGAEPFHRAFGDDGLIDLRKIPRQLRGAANRMVSNSERIAFSELHNARAEAEIQHFIEDPYVSAVKWELSQNRGRSWAPPDECDILAYSDFYDLGPGVFPVKKVPPPPHPWDGCERRAVVSDTPLKEKPNPELLRDPWQVPFPQGNRVTAAAAERARQSAWTAISISIGR